VNEISHLENICRKRGLVTAESQKRLAERVALFEQGCRTKTGIPEKGGKEKSSRHREGERPCATENAASARPSVTKNKKNPSFVDCRDGEGV